MSFVIKKSQQNRESGRAKHAFIFSMCPMVASLTGLDQIEKETTIINGRVQCAKPKTIRCRIRRIVSAENRKIPKAIPATFLIPVGVFVEENGRMGVLILVRKFAILDPAQNVLYRSQNPANVGKQNESYVAAQLLACTVASCVEKNATVKFTIAKESVMAESVARVTRSSNKSVSVVRRREKLSVAMKEGKSTAVENHAMVIMNVEFINAQKVVIQTSADIAQQLLRESPHVHVEKEPCKNLT